MRIQLWFGVAVFACSSTTLGGCGPSAAAEPEVIPAKPPFRQAQPVRFVAFGDAGRGSETQHAVAQAMARVCAARGCDFAVTLGDNFYDDGVETIDDPEFQTKFEQPYAPLAMPIYATNGNHDLAWDGQQLQAWKADLYVQYSQRSPRWRMPAPYYSVRHGDVELFALDTTQLLHGDTEAQRAWLVQALDASDAPWKIVVGHHPYRSNGLHGDAKEPLRTVFWEVVCGRADVYLSGHDHSLQWVSPFCGVELLISGAGASTTPCHRVVNPSIFQDDQHPGFLWLEVRGDQMTGAFYDQHANPLFERTVTR